MRTILILVVLGLLLGAGLLARRAVSAFGGPPQAAPRDALGDDPLTFFDLSTATLDGDTVSLGQWRGRVVLVVNTASKCGFTPQYAGLEKLHRELAPRGLVVMGFPSNDFRNQEPGDADAIRTFCRQRYGVTFPLFAKRHVTGPEMDPVYRWLTRNLEPPTWNFTKYLVDRRGTVRFRLPPKMTPDDPVLRRRIEELLAEPAP